MVQFLQRAVNGAAAGVIVLFTCLSSGPAIAQISNTGSFLQAGIEDSQLLVREYIRPYAEGFGAVSNTGWVHSASPHSVLGFDVTLRFGAANIPESMGSFDLTDLGLQQLRAVNPAETQTPTISGPNRSGPEVEVFKRNPVTGDDVIITRFDMPTGSGLSWTLAPMVQASVGLPYNTDIMFRFVPTTGVPNYGDFGLFGIGFNHSLDQWLGGYLPLDLSVMAAWMNVGLTGRFTLAPSPDDYDSDPDNLDTPARWAGQQAALSSSSWNLNLMAGRSLPFISFYGGIGLQGTRMDLAMTGQYPVIELEVDQAGNAQRVLASVTDPFTVEIDTGAVFRSFLGASLKLGLVYVSAEVTYADYVVYNAGMGISFR